ncbi:MAG: F0F1 ATP synthase subunit alpha [Lachnospiraceae bacterium]|nr:F0F1 ATP synthase subunit alpha [Lachnospiraceae bacterium]
MSKEVTPKILHTAHLRYVIAPTKEQLDGFKAFLLEKYEDEEFELLLEQDDSLGNGFILETEKEVYDWSRKGRGEQLQKRLKEILLEGGNLSREKLMPMVREGVHQFRLAAVTMEIGHVLSVGDGIVQIEGLDHAMYGEIVVFEDGTKGMVQNIGETKIGAILFGDDRDVKQGSRVARTGKNAGVPVGEGFLGRVVNALGAPIDGGGEIEEIDYRPIEEPAPGIVDRKSVSVPLQTGIMAIDAMFPIGRGQRELIIGDRQTGKTTIAMDTIINQKGKNCYCIYVAIGQKASTIAALTANLKKKGAMEYTTIVAATAAEPAPLQYIAPYAGTSMAEYFMHKGKDVLIIYDDLSKHAVAYRALSLLLGRSPGREAFPGDVFYLHSRLLERSSRLSKEKGGGSITALPIIETQDGDVSAYIPTNVISITDGQIFLESDLFFEGQRPAVNVGLSVSRVGGAAQTKAMKSAAGSLRIDLAQYREMAVFTQFSSDLDETTKNQLLQGKILMELLKQPQGNPLSLAHQVILLTVAQGKLMLNVPVNKVSAFRKVLLDHFDEKGADVIRDIESTGKLSDENKMKILDEAGICKAAWLANLEKE